MARVLIHACPAREWYVYDYLMPSLLTQGVQDVSVWLDSKGAGCLESFVASCEAIGDEGGTWHLQDDVIISADFHKKITEYDDGIACGYANPNFGPFMDATGRQPVVFMWYSFPCTRIPNSYAKAFAAWYRSYAQTSLRYENYVRRCKGDDTLFREWLIEAHPHDWVVNLKPNLVDHIDFLLGGSTVNKHRVIPSRAFYFTDRHLVDALADQLATRA